MRKLKLLLTLVILAGFTTFWACNNNDETPMPMIVSDITATGTDLQSGEQTMVDLNAAAAATDVPLDAEITVTFDKNVDPATINTGNITLSGRGDNVLLTVTAGTASATLMLNDDLERGVEYTLTLSGNIQAEDGGGFSETTRTFTAAGRLEVEPPQAESMVAYWKFDGDGTDQTGTYDVTDEVGANYDVDRFGAIASAAVFDGDETILEVPNADELLNTADFTISFWAKTNSTEHTDADGNPAGHFVFGLGAFMGIEYEIAGDYHSAKFGISYEAGDGTGVSEDMWFPALATDNTNGGWQGWTFAKSIPEDQMEMLLKDTWLHVVYTYNATDMVGSLYYNGELMKTFDFNLWPENDIKRTVVGMMYRGAEPEVYNTLAFGFIHSRAGTLWDDTPWGDYAKPTANHFKGSLDDVRIFHAALTDSEVEQLFNDESPN